MEKIKTIKERLGVHEKSQHGLRGHVAVHVINKETGKKSLWYEDDNIIPISGYQWILMKMFNLKLDSVHDPESSYEDIGQDTSIIIPDLNNDNQLKIGVEPSKYSVITDDIPVDHFIQGFMVGNGGAGEDAISTKNTSYSFIKLRNPLPFQQTTVVEGLDPSLSGKYLGAYRQSDNVINYFIKKFDSRPHIYHNWWRDGQKWDYIDPVRQSDLGPGEQATPKTNRIETYAEVEMSIDTMNLDCLGVFKNTNNDSAAVINELGLVAFDAVPGERSMAEKIYSTKIKRVINLIFDNNRSETATDEIIALCNEIPNDLTQITALGQKNINAFVEIIEEIGGLSTISDEEYKTYQDKLCEVDEEGYPTNIGVEAFYNQSGTFINATDHFVEYLNSVEFKELTADEAQRIKLITYYTFKSIPLEENARILINYRIYAN